MVHNLPQLGLSDHFDFDMIYMKKSMSYQRIVGKQVLRSKVKFLREFNKLEYI